MAHLPEARLRKRCPVVILLAVAALASANPPAIGFVARWGGATKDIAYAVVSDDAKGVFVVGATYSHDFPVTAAKGPGPDQSCAFATKLNSASGSVLYSTVICSRGLTFGRAAAPAASGALWVAGSTDSRGLPVSADAFQRSYGGGSRTAIGTGDGFIARWSADGRAGSYATYFGGSGDDTVHALLEDGMGGVWAAGRTNSRNFPVTDDAPLPRLPGGDDGFLSYVDANGHLAFSTLIGGAGIDEVTALARFDTDRLLLAGNTSSSQVGSGGPPRSDMDGFVARFDTRSKRLDWFRRLGRAGDDRLKGIVRLQSGAVVAVGDTESACSTLRGERDGWVAVVSPRGEPLDDYCIGGDRLDEVQGVAVSGDRVWVTGRTRSTRFPRAWTQTVRLATGFDRTFVARLAPLQRSVDNAWLLTPHVGRGNAIAVAADGTLFATGETTDAGKRFWVPERSNLVPSRGAFSLGAQRGTTDPYLVALSAK